MIQVVYAYLLDLAHPRMQKAESATQPSGGGEDPSQLPEGSPNLIIKYTCYLSGLSR